eukprot:10751229-Alexandrium_andersonii.AAC.2
MLDRVLEGRQLRARGREERLDRLWRCVAHLGVGCRDALRHLCDLREKVGRGEASLQLARELLTGGRNCMTRQSTRKRRRTAPQATEVRHSQGARSTRGAWESWERCGGHAQGARGTSGRWGSSGHGARAPFAPCRARNCEATASSK